MVNQFHSLNKQKNRNAMSLKALAFLLLLINSFAMADYGAPYGVQENSKLIKKAIGNFKSINDSMIAYFSEIKKQTNLCKHMPVSTQFNCGEDSDCKSFLRSPVKKRAEYCLNQFQILGYRGGSLRIDNHNFQYDLKDAKYGMFPAAIARLNKSAIKIDNQILSAQKFLSDGSQVFSKKYIDILNQEYSDAKNAGMIAGTTDAICAYLKNQIDTINLQFMLNDKNTDYAFWYRFYDQIKATLSLAEVMRPKCTLFVPADYSSQEIKAKQYLSSLDEKKWIQQRCSIKENQDLNICKKQNKNKIFLNPYTFNLLAGVQK